MPLTAGPVERKLNPDKFLVSNHAYSIVGYDETTDVVKYINPWNSAFVIEMPLKDLAQYVSKVTVCQF